MHAIQVRRYWLPWDQDGQVGVTLAHMRQLARDGAVHPSVRQYTTAVLIAAGARSPLDAAVAIRDALASQVYFVPDPRDAELLHEPGVLAGLLLRDGIVGADCDDVAVLAAACALAVGLSARYVTVAFGSTDAPSGGFPWRHVWAEIGSHDAWVAVDPTRSPWLRQPVVREWIVHV